MQTVRKKMSLTITDLPAEVLCRIVKFVIETTPLSEKIFYPSPEVEGLRPKCVDAPLVARFESVRSLLLTNLMFRNATTTEMEKRIKGIRLFVEEQQPRLLATATEKRLQAYRNTNEKAKVDDHILPITWIKMFNVTASRDPPGSMISHWKPEIDRHWISLFHDDATKASELEVEELIEEKIWAQWELKMFERLKRTGECECTNRRALGPMRSQFIFREQ